MSGDKEELKFYQVSWIGDRAGDWDTYDSFVVCASSKEEARSYHPNQAYQFNYNTQQWLSITDGAVYQQSSSHSTWALVPVKELVVVELLKKEKGIVLASYHAG